MNLIEAYSVIKLKMGYTKKVVDNLKQFSEIKQISHLAGMYDLMVEVQAENIEVINDLIVEKIDPIDGIVEINTFIVLKNYK